MEENVTRYTTIIETQVEGEEDVKGLGETVEDTSSEFQRLQRQILTTKQELQKAAAEGNKTEFNKLKGQLRDLEDQLEAVQINSSKFEDNLKQLPGPAGQVGSAIGNFDKLLKQLAANPIFIAVVVLTGLFFALKESLERTEEGTAKLNKITEAFEKILNGLFAIIEPLANIIVDFTISLLENEKVMTGLSVTAGVLSATFTTLFNIIEGLVDIVVNNLIVGFRTLIDVGSAAGKVLKGVFTLDLGLIKEGLNDVKDAYVSGVKDVVKNVVAGAKQIANGVVDGITSGFNSGVKAFEEGSKRLSKAEKEAEAKRLEEAKKAEEERLKLIQAASKLQTEAYLSSLTDRDREITKRETKLTEDLVILENGRTAALAQARAEGIKDLSKIEDEYRIARLRLEEQSRVDIEKINQTYDAADIQKRIQSINTRFNKIVTETNGGYDELIGLVNERELELLSNVSLTEDEITQIQLDAINARKDIIQRQTNDELLGLELRFNAVVVGNVEGYDELISIINENERIILSNTKLTEEERLEIQQDFAKQRQQVNTNGYDTLISIIDERERIILSNTKLTENERLKIQQDFAKQRAEVRATELDDNLLALDNELNNLTTSFERRREIIAEQEAILLQLEGGTEAQRTAIRQQAAMERMRIDEEELMARAEAQNAYINLVGQFGAVLQQLAGENKKLAITGIVVEQAASVGRIIANTAVANAKAVAALPITGGQPFVAINTISAGLGIASSIAAAAKAISAINSAESGGGASAGGSSITSSIPTPRVGGTAAPQITGVDEGIDPTRQIANTLQQREEKPIKAFVVSTDVSSQQALDRRTNRAASFGG
jgi:hypothetical protein